MRKPEAPKLRKPSKHLADVRGWLDNNDPFFTIMDRIIEGPAKSYHAPFRVAERREQVQATLFDLTDGKEGRA